VIYSAKTHGNSEIVIFYVGLYGLKKEWVFIKDLRGRPFLLNDDKTAAAG
jgi:hypothetical protein